MRIGLDVMGGDFAPSATIKGALLALQELPKSSRIVLIGDESSIRQTLQKEGAESDSFDILHAPDVIAMGDHPTKAFLKKPNSSISVGFHHLKNKSIDGFASNIVLIF